MKKDMVIAMKVDMATAIKKTRNNLSSSKYLFKTFVSPNNKYFIYDTPSNNIYEIPKELFLKFDNLIEIYFERSSSKLKRFIDSLIGAERKQIKLIKTAIKNGIISENKLSKVEFKFNIDKVNSRMPDSLDKLILGITNDCNLRCKYCAYSGNYVHLREHNKDSMSFEVAQKALELYNDFCKDKKNIDISFYGGEPLINFDLIKKVISYEKNKFPNKNHIYNISTNGLSLTRDFASWFINENSVFIKVSIDGPENIHNKSRVKLDKTGSFQTVYRNLKLLYELDQEIYKKRVSFHCTLNCPSTDILKINDYFKTDLLFKNNDITVAFVEYDKTFEAQKFTKINLCDSPKNEKIILDKIKLKDGDKILNNLFSKDFMQIHNRSKELLNNTLLLDSQCEPFSTGFFVDTEGELNLCQNTEKSVKIGNVQDGINKNELSKLLKDYKKRQKDCIGCWANRLCKICIRHIYTDAGYDHSRHKLNCDYMKESLKITLGHYCYTIENENTIKT